ncbi:hypothetical protein FRB96_006651 [Tulasnella sp. 330]|nr:hypothetical protein FRB96_006651 [Tulasnella sp. 330]KAG8888434.1 hypothetical protein FRB98_007646 [Tulasnella sp. 332]
MSANGLLLTPDVVLWRRQVSLIPSNNGSDTGNSNGIQVFPAGYTKPSKTVTTFILPCVGLMMIMVTLASALTWLHRRRLRRIRSEFYNGGAGRLHQERPTMHSVFVKDWDMEASEEKTEYKWCDIQPLSATVSRSSTDSMRRTDLIDEKPASISSGSSGGSARRREREDMLSTLPGFAPEGTDIQTATALVAVMIAMPQPPSVRLSRVERSMGGFDGDDVETQVPEQLIIPVVVCTFVAAIVLSVARRRLARRRHELASLAQALASDKDIPMKPPITYGVFLDHRDEKASNLAGLQPLSATYYPGQDSKSPKHVQKVLSSLVGQLSPSQLGSELLRSTKKVSVGDSSTMSVSMIIAMPCDTRDNSSEYSRKGRVAGESSGISDDSQVPDVVVGNMFLPCRSFTPDELRTDAELSEGK